jgi:hypothetical protein
MASQTEICNAALSQVGYETLTAVDTATKQGRVCLAAWDLVLDALLAVHQWGFTIKRADLQQVLPVPVYGFDYAYALPADCLRLIEVYPDTEYQLEGGKILNSEDTLSCRYIARITQPGLFPPWFTVALSDMLAARICFPLEGSAAKRKALEETAAMSLNTAISRDAREAWTLDLNQEDDSWLIARDEDVDVDTWTETV